MPRRLIANLVVFLAYAQMVGWGAMAWYALSNPSSLFNTNFEPLLEVASSVGLILLGWFILRALVTWAGEIRESSA